MNQVTHDRVSNDEGTIAIPHPLLSSDRLLIAYLMLSLKELSVKFNTWRNAMSAAVEALRAEVERNRTVDGSAVQLINSLADQFEAVKDDPAAIQALADDLRGSSDEVAAAVLARTPQAPGGGGGGGVDENGNPIP